MSRHRRQQKKRARRASKAHKARLVSQLYELMPQFGQSLGLTREDFDAAVARDLEAEMRR